MRIHYFIKNFRLLKYSRHQYFLSMSKNYIETNGFALSANIKNDFETVYYSGDIFGSIIHNHVTNHLIMPFNNVKINGINDLDLEYFNHDPEDIKSVLCRINFLPDDLGYMRQK